MNQENLSSEITIREIVNRGKYYIIFIAVCLFSLSFLMTKLHPKKVNRGKEYNYLYSIFSSIEHDEEVNYSLLEEKMQEYKELFPIYDGLITYKFIKEKNYDDFSVILDRIRKRLVVKNGLVNNFTDASVLVDSKKERAIERCLLLQDELGKNYLLTKIYNMYRVMLMERESGNSLEAEKLRKNLIVFLETVEGKNYLDSVIFKMVKEKISDSA